MTLSSINKFTVYFIAPIIKNVMTKISEKYY